MGFAGDAEAADYTPLTASHNLLSSLGGRDKSTMLSWCFWSAGPFAEALSTLSLFCMVIVLSFVILPD